MRTPFLLFRFILIRKLEINILIALLIHLTSFMESFSCVSSIINSFRHWAKRFNNTFELAFILHCLVHQALFLLSFITSEAHGNYFLILCIFSISQFLAIISAMLVCLDLSSHLIHITIKLYSTHFNALRLSLLRFDFFSVLRTLFFKTLIYSVF